MLSSREDIRDQHHSIQEQIVRILRTPLGIVIIVVCVGAAGYTSWKIYHNAKYASLQVVAAQKAKTVSEHRDLTQAMENFRLQYGTVPRLDHGPAEIQKRFRLMFPRYLGDPVKDLAAEGLVVDKLDDAEMLVFWLGGLRELSGSHKLIGFSTNPASPFDRSHRGRPLFEFDPERLVDVDGDHWLEYQTPLVGAERGVYKLGGDKARGLPPDHCLWSACRRQCHGRGSPISHKL